MKYTVLRSFTDKYTQKAYYKGNSYPGEKVSKERLEELATKNNTQKKVLIEVVGSSNKADGGNPYGEPADQDGQDGEFPKHTGGPWYVLSNGVKIQGKKKLLLQKQN
ncbi:hypothetical protein F0342_21615 [Bacillus sp. CH30_1T]|uniref:hypothetical protein n=1 Tax=Bacillus sp. CH30_1T TaxID=2604836 RepID=UPI0011EBAFA5|nr:hypothetical protein [Bacillus sp. CH30_1T]KAA0560762.1 hypothetical protein F0342_21615 [Bacillus sp. CH30_1T]